MVSITQVDADEMIPASLLLIFVDRFQSLSTCFPAAQKNKEAPMEKALRNSSESTHSFPEKWIWKVVNAKEQGTLIIQTGS